MTVTLNLFKKLLVLAKKEVGKRWTPTNEVITVVARKWHPSVRPAEPIYQFSPSVNFLHNYRFSQFRFPSGGSNQSTKHNPHSFVPSSTRISLTFWKCCTFICLFVCLLVSRNVHGNRKYKLEFFSPFDDGVLAGCASEIWATHFDAYYCWHAKMLATQKPSVWFSRSPRKGEPSILLRAEHIFFFGSKPIASVLCLSEYVKGF